MLRHVALIAITVLASGCLFGKKEVAKAPEPVNQVVPDCYTVVLFDPHPIKPPEEGVPPENARFLGHWKEGAWNGKWCHDLLVTEVTKDGVVKVVDMHAPYEPWGQPATAFQRTGRIDKDGNLRLRYGTESVAYRVEGSHLVAERSGTLGNLEAMLRKAGSEAEGRMPPARPANTFATAPANGSSGNASKVMQGF